MTDCARIRFVLNCCKKRCGPPYCSHEQRLRILFIGLLCLATGGFLTYGFSFVASNHNWYLGYMIVAYVVGIINVTCIWSKKK